MFDRRWFPNAVNENGGIDAQEVAEMGEVRALTPVRRAVVLRTSLLATILGSSSPTLAADSPTLAPRPLAISILVVPVRGGGRL